MDLDLSLQQLAVNPSTPLDVAEVGLALAQDEYPDLDLEAYLSELTGMAHEVRGYVRGDLEAKVRGLCRYLFHDMGFRGNVQEYYDPRNSYLNQVLDRRTGIPITLCVTTMAVATRAGLEVAGVGLPGHFVAKAVEGDQEIFFDPFHGGRLLSPEECERLVEQVTGVPFRATPAHLRALPAGPLVQRMLNNLKAVYLRDGDFARACRVMERLLQLHPEDAHQHRDLGVSWLRAGRPGKAIDHLTTYLTAVPQAADGEAVRKTLLRAQKEVSQWN